MEKFDVGISGYGPVGAIAALTLAKQGIHVVIIEKEKEIYSLPRAIAVDNEILRLFSLLDIPTNRQGEFVPSFTYQFCNEKNELLFGINRGPRDDLDFCPKTALFRQPELEKSIRELIQNDPLITVYLEEELQDFVQHNDYVMISTTKRQLHVQYLLGCDGASSSVRKLANIQLNEQVSYEEPWLIVDALIHDEVETPEIMQQICDPSRAISYIPRSGTNNRRWEIQIKDSDDPTTIQTADFIQPILERWLDPHQYQIERTAIYTFRALEAEKWRVHRVFLLGDAAHMMPPFLGQGLSSGVRDAVNLSWKLAQVMKQTLHPSVLDSYELERKEHVRMITFIAISLGKVLMMKDKSKVALRNNVMKMLHKLPITSNKMDNLHVDIPKMHDYISTARNGNPFNGHRLKNAEVRFGKEILLLDNLIKLNFGIVTFGKHIPKIDTDWLTLGIKHIHILPKNSRKQFTLPHAVIVEDINGIFESYFNQMKTTGPIIRPDKYILGTTAQSKKILRTLLKGSKYADASKLESPTFCTLLEHILEEEKDHLKGPFITFTALSTLSITSFILLRKRGS